MSNPKDKDDVALPPTLEHLVELFDEACKRRRIADELLVLLVEDLKAAVALNGALLRRLQQPTPK